MWTRTENQAKHILLNRTRDGMRVQVNVFLMKENDWRLSLGGIHHSIPQMFSNWRWQSAVWPHSQLIFSHPVQSVSEATMIHFQSYSWGHCCLKLVCASDGSGFCYPEVWINSVTNWRLFVCTLPSWQGGVLVDEVETPQSSSSHHRLFCSASPCLARTQHGVPTGQDFVREAVCVGQQEASFRRSLAENEAFPTMHWDKSITNVSRVCVGLMRKWWNLCS